MNNKKFILGVISCIVLILFTITICIINKKDDKVKNLTAIVLSATNKQVIVQDKNNLIYTFDYDDMNVSAGDKVAIKYTGVLDKNTSIQEVKIIDYKAGNSVDNDIDGDVNLLEGGIFKDYYNLAKEKLKELTLDEKIGQLFLVRYPSNSAISDLKKYKFGGYVFFERDFKDKTEEEVKTMISNLQEVSIIPLLTAVDEEGGKVVRVSSNPNLVSEKFKSSRTLYNTGGLNLIREDTKEKSKILYNLGINLNLAPVVDVSTNSSDYMYERTIGENTEITSKYAKTVIEASKDTGVSYTLKHFPGYGNNSDTHIGSSVDSRSYDDIVENDLPPFEAGIDAGAEAVLVSHNIVNSIDSSNPASLSAAVHNLLRNKLKFTGISITDDLDMSAVSSINNVSVQALLAGNDLLISTNYVEDISNVKSAINSGVISENLIDNLALRVLAWKYYKGLMYVNQK